jgi:hypothetical protein
LVKKALELEEFDNVDVALIIYKHGHYLVASKVELCF